MMWTSEQARAPLEGALRAADAVSTLGRSLWLYVLLLAKAGDKGRVIRTTARLAKDLSVPEDTIARWLERLRDARLITISSPPPFLVGRIVFWPGRRSSEPSASSAVPHSRLDDLDSNSYSSAVAISNNGNRGLGEGDELRELARTILGDTADAELPAILAKYPAETVRVALVRASKAPDREIRKSRVALFRYILAQFAKNPS